MAWSPFSVSGVAGSALPNDTVCYGPDIPGESELKLLGRVEGKRVLVLGCGAGSHAIALAKAGARVLAVDEDAAQLALARDAADAAGARIELHHAPLAELAFCRADTIDAVLSVHSLNHVSDIGRVFRQIHRVLKPELQFVVSVPHPIFTLVDPGGPEPLRIRRSAFDEQPYTAIDLRVGTHTRSMSTIFTELGRAGFRVDTILEPQPALTAVRSAHWSPAMEHIPATLILRARKQGI